MGCVYSHMLKRNCILTLMVPLVMSKPPAIVLHDNVHFSHKHFRHYYEKKRCKAHNLAPCPACKPEDYMQRRVVKAVQGALKRLGMPQTKPILTYLGADSWRQVLEHMEVKRACWNLEVSKMPMTPTNIAVDHIRPVRAFLSEAEGARMFLCNHYTNLQPLLLEDNTWKGDCWSDADEAYWHDHILMKTDYDRVYYPKTAPSQPSLIFARRLEK